MKISVKNNHLILKKEYLLNSRNLKYLINNPKELEDIRLFILEDMNFINVKVNQTDVLSIEIEMHFPDENKYLTEWDLYDLEELMNAARRSVSEKINY